MIAVEDAARIIRSEARRWHYSDLDDRVQDGWVILLEANPNAPALARTILRRRYANLSREANARKRGAGFAIGRLDAGWEDGIGVDPRKEIVAYVTTKQLISILGFRSIGRTRQAFHQALSRAKVRWAKLRRPFDPT